MITRSMGRAAAVAFVLLAGCGSSYQDTCERAGACAGWNDADVDYCVADANGDEEVANQYDCGDQYAAFADCVENTGKCSESAFTFDCDHEEEELSNCKDSSSAEDIDLD